MQLRQLAGTAGVQQREAGRNMSKAEPLEKVAQHISEKQARRGSDAALLSWAAFAAQTSCCVVPLKPMSMWFPLHTSVPGHKTIRSHWL